MARLAVGIDLGTTHTVVAWAPIDGAAPIEIFPIPQLVSATEVAARPLLPSFLYAPVASEAVADPFGDAPWVLGEHARRRGAEVHGRAVASAKSWLCHPTVDRTAAILPWGAEEGDVPKISPLEASARLLAHVRRTWEDARPDAPLADQDVVLTVPASFDEGARELTVEAAKRAGLSVRLLEEPQAAFYDSMRTSGRDALARLVERAGGDALVLVCDVGGGTTDLSLIVVKASLEVERIAVGHHLLLGGDNMDLALAHACEARLPLPDRGDEGRRLDPARFGQLVLACRSAKERLLGASPPDAVKVTLLGSGAKLVGGSLSTSIARDEAESTVLDGFFPIVAAGERPARARGGLVAFGLPYERDVAITRHVSHFCARHAERRAPAAVLLNGGVFHAARVVERLTTVLASWSGEPVETMPHADPDLAVARGAVAYALALAGHGAKIGGGSAHGYYVGIDAGAGRRRAVCVVPRGASEGERHAVTGRPLALVVGKAVRFDLFASDDAAVHRTGEIVDVDEERFLSLPPARVAFGERDRAGEIQVELEGELSAIGTLDLACVEIGGEKRRFALAFQLRGGASAEEPSSHRPPDAGHDGSSARLGAAVTAIDRVFGKGRGDVGGREVKDLVRELERLLGPRAEWSMPTLRSLYDAILARNRGRRRTADHERVFWLLAGYCIRPGFGDPGDVERARALAPLFAERLAFPDEARNWQQFWIAWRRASGGLDEATQTAMRDVVDPLLAPSEKRLKKPKGWKLEAESDLLDLVSSLERVPAARRSELGGWILERTWTDRDPRLWAALGRLGARMPAYASAHHVIAAHVAERWLDHLLRVKWEEMPTASQAAVELARVTLDRARDVSERARREVERRLVSAGASAEWIAAVREHVPRAAADRAAFFGDALPAGLKLI